MVFLFKNVWEFFTYSQGVLSWLIPLKRISGAEHFVILFFPFFKIFVYMLYFSALCSFSFVFTLTRIIAGLVITIAIIVTAVGLFQKIVFWHNRTYVFNNVMQFLQVSTNSNIKYNIIQVEGCLKLLMRRRS